MDFSLLFSRLGGVRPIGGIDAFLPLNSDDIVNIESCISGQLPEAYESYLRAYGAVAFVTNVVITPVNPLPSTISPSGTDTIQAFYGKESPNRTMFSLLARIEHYRDRMPSTMIPIGDNGLGNLYCIGIAGPEYGKVFYWDRHGEFDLDEFVAEQGIDLSDFEDGDTICDVPPDVWFRNVYLIAESFQIFLLGLKIDPSES